MEKNQQEERLVLRTEGLVKRYGKRTVVNDVSFDVKQGEIVGLLGPNGAGKTTSFYMTTGLIVPNGGHIYLGNEEVTNYPVYKRARAGIGYLAQEASVFRKMSVEDNILSVLEMTGKPRDYQLQKLEELIKEFRLGKVRKNKGDQLSGGERRRTEIARCLAIEPKFIMLDEPFSLRGASSSRARLRNWRRTRLCARNTSPTRSCSARRTSNCSKRSARRKKRKRCSLRFTVYSLRFTVYR